MPILKAVADHIASLPQTSITREPPHADEVTVKFRKFTPWKHTAYQCGDVAGFLISDARELVRRGKADVIDPATGAIIPIVTAEPKKGDSLPPFGATPTHWAVPASEGPGPGWTRIFTRESELP